MSKTAGLSPSSTQAFRLLQSDPADARPPDSLVAERLRAKPAEVGQDAVGRTVGAALPGRQV
jgi:hypothetical protein